MNSRHRRHGCHSCWSSAWATTSDIWVDFTKGIQVYHQLHNFEHSFGELKEHALPLRIVELHQHLEDKAKNLHASLG